VCSRSGADRFGASLSALPTKGVELLLGFLDDDSSIERTFAMQARADDGVQDEALRDRGGDGGAAGRDRQSRDAQAWPQAARSAQATIARLRRSSNWGAGVVSRLGSPVRRHRAVE
jgi:hypothetical protein